jgi:S1-C subfamily serine protease
VQVAMTDASRPDGGARADDADAAATALAARRARMNSLSSATQRWLAVVSADRDNLSAHGIPVHPNRHYEREYGLHDGDVVTAINGVPITDEDALDNALKSSTGTMSLTFSHDGAPQTVNVPLSQ